MSPLTVTPVVGPVYSIRQRLARRVAVQVGIALALMVLIIYASAAWLMERKQAVEQAQKMAVIQTIVREAAQAGGEPRVQSTLALVAQRRPSTRLEVLRADGSVFYRDPDEAPWRLSAHQRSDHFAMDVSAQGGGVLSATLTVDTEQDTGLMRGLAWTLLLVPLLGAALVGAGTAWRVRRELQPLKRLADQTAQISAQRLGARLALTEVAEELAPWLTQFNALMDRLEAAVAQLEAFNADVAHELRTPLAALIGHTEVALSRERPALELRETMGQSLVELQQLSAMVGDMLFLAQADRGALARRGPLQSLNALAQRVADYHEFTLEDMGLRAQVQGDAQVQVDEALVQRALSNLLANATRYGQRGSRVVVRIEAAGSHGEVSLCVENQGAPIDAQALPRLFDRFYRADAARQDSSQHHGLGLAIVAAVARMHGGQTWASSEAGYTRVGLVLAVR